MPQGWTVVAEPIAPPQAAPPAGWTRVDETPHFQTENEKDATGNAVVDPNTFGTLARHVGAQVNPLPLGQMIPFPKAAGGAGWDAPLQVLKNIGAAHLHVWNEATAARDKGDYATATRKYLDFLALGVGPVLDKAADSMQDGHYMAGIGDAIGLGLALFGGKALENLPRPEIHVTPRVNPNPVERAAVAFGESRGVPIDPGTATGSQFVKNVQKKIGGTWGGANTVESFQGRQASALERVAGELADDAHPAPATPESAGKAVQGDVTGLVQTLHKQASDAYGRLRAMEADPANAADVPAPPPSVDVQVRMADSLGAVPTKSELAELRRIRTEMVEIPYVKRTWNDLRDESGVKGNAAGGHADIVAGSAGAAVYDDILAAQPGLSNMSRGDVVAALDRALETGTFTNAAKGAIAVARERLANPKGTQARRAMLPPGAGEQPMRHMLMPVDLTDVKAQLRPLFDRLDRKRELAGSLMGAEARAIHTLDGLVNGPDHAPVSVVDAVLSDIKALARGASMPELRNAGQGAAAQAVQRLNKAVLDAVDRVGPEARAALEDGRGATTAKYVVAELLESIRDEPVQAYRQAVAPKDTAIAHLRQVQEMSPESIPKIGRAFLEELITKATTDGGFQRAAGLQADWRRLGIATKLALYGPELTTQLDQFFLLAKKIGDNPNPSGTAQVLNATNLLAGIPSYALAKILYSEKASQLLRQGLRTAIGPGPRSAAAMTIARGNVLQAAREVGVQVQLPKAAGDPAGPAEPQR